jgi:hypothetical protein
VPGSLDKKGGRRCKLLHLIENGTFSPLLGLTNPALVEKRMEKSSFFGFTAIAKMGE